MPIKMPFVRVYTRFPSVHEHRACSVCFHSVQMSSLNQISMFYIMVSFGNIFNLYNISVSKDFVQILLQSCGPKHLITTTSGF